MYHYLLPHSSLSRYSSPWVLNYLRIILTCIFHRSLPTPSPHLFAHPLHDIKNSNSFERSNSIQCFFSFKLLSLIIRRLFVCAFFVHVVVLFRGPPPGIHFCVTSGCETRSTS